MEDPWGCVTVPVQLQDQPPCRTHFVIGGVVFGRGRRRLSTGTARAVAAVALAVQAESEEEGAG